MVRREVSHCQELGILNRLLGVTLLQVDTDRSGGISFDEFVAMMQLKEVETDFEREINEAFKFFDKDGDGEVGDVCHRSALRRWSNHLVG